MARQAYVDSSLIGTGHIRRALICGHDGTVWATSAGFAPSLPELKALIKGFSDSADIRSSGITLATDKYLTLIANNRSIYGKMGEGGVIVVKTEQAVIVGVFQAGTQPGAATRVVEQLADYLIESGY